MRHFVAYHNVERTGQQPVEYPFAYSRSRNAEQTAGNRLWLITGEGKPRKYSLTLTFIVEEVGILPSAEQWYFMIGREVRPIRKALNGKPWFPVLKRQVAHFVSGVAEIDDKKLIAELKSLRSEELQRRQRTYLCRSIINSGGFLHKGADVSSLYLRTLRV